MSLRNHFTLLHFFFLVHTLSNILEREAQVLNWRKYKKSSEIVNQI